jgi:NADH-quinone oxidoreductase subunit N
MILADLAPMVPELFLLSATCLLLLADLWISDQRRGLTHLLALVALVATAALLLRDGGAAAEPVRAFGGLFVRDAVAGVLKLVVLGVTAGVFVYAKPYLEARGILKGEFYSLCLFAVLGIMVLVSAGNLVTVYLGLELMALSTYALVALHRDDRGATEAALKYFVLGALASGMLLYGMSMLYGATGSLDLATIAEQAAGAAAQPGETRSLMLLGVVFVVVGIAFKFGAAPFHMWLPDVYHGAPTAITLFIGSAPKLAAFGMAYRMLEGGVGPLDGWWAPALTWLAVASLVVGNLFAIAQTNLKRMLAYSTISHVGFLFLGLAAADANGYAAAMFYAISYAIMATAGFGAIVLLSRRGFEADQIADFRGLARRSPWHAWMVLAVMASLAGVPPFLGFWAKLGVLRAAVNADLLWLALVGVVFAVVGAYYYLRVVKVMFFEEPTEQYQPVINADVQLRGLFTANALLLLVLGVFSGPLMAWCARALGV